MGEKLKTLNKRNQDALRAKIQADKIIMIIQAFVLGTKVKLPNGTTAVPKMSAIRLRASLGLLNKIIPDYKATELILDEEIRNAVISASPMTEEQWKEKYGEGMPVLAAVPKDE